MGGWKFGGISVKFPSTFCGNSTNLTADISNGLSQEIVPNLRILRIFTENWILRLQKAEFDDLYAIGSEFASPTRSHTPFPAVSAKNAVSENLYCQFFAKISGRFLHYLYEGKFQTNRDIFFILY